MTEEKNTDVEQQVSLSLAPTQPNQRGEPEHPSYQQGTHGGGESQPHAGTRDFAGEIVKCLARITAISGYGPAIVFDDWTHIVEASLEALPNHLKSVARTGHWAEDTPQAAEVFAQVRARYSRGANPSTHQRVWESFGQAFALLLESAAPGLWQYADFDVGYMGPDVIGQAYMDFANYDPKWSAQYWTPWNVALLASSLLIPQGARDVHDRLKQALTHPDNQLGAAVLLALLAIPEDDPTAHREWFLTRVIPAAMPFYTPISFCEPAIGSGVMMLAAASRYPDWAVAMRLVVFQGQDTDPTCVRMANINSMLYGLNGYALKMAEAVGEVMEAQGLPEQPVQPTRCLRLQDIPKSPQAALDQAVRLRQRASPTARGTSPKFEELVQLSLELDRYPGEIADNRADQVASIPLAGKRCVVCRSAPEERPGLWYVIDNVVYCPDCAPLGAGEPAGEAVEVRGG